MSKTSKYDSSTVKRPNTNMQLMDRVGNKGKYQVMILVIFCAMWCITGMALMGTPFFFLNRKFTCKKIGLMEEICSEAVCQLPSDTWKDYLDPSEDYIQSISTELGNYYCDDTFYIDLVSSSTYLGAFVGYVFFSFFSDNFGRRTTIILTWGVATMGTIMLVFSQNLYMVSVGLFFIGGGADASINICFNFLSEVVQNQTRQKFSVILQPWFAIGACILTTTYIWVDNWRLAVIVLLMIPSCVVLFFTVLYIEETPQFLLRKGIPKTLKALNRIGKINLGVKNILQEEDVANVIQEQLQQKKFHAMITPIDLCRFSSLRLRTICLFIIVFSVYALYYGPALVIDKIGFNIYVSSYVVQVSQLLVYIPLYFLIDAIPRQKAGIVLFSISGLCASVLLFVNKPKTCDFCNEAVIELVIIAIFRSSVALYFIINYIYMVELYPSRTRALGCGIASSFGTIASTISPIFLGYFQRKDINVNMAFAVLAFISVGVSTLLPETLGVPLQDEIEEIKMIKNQEKKSRYESQKGNSQYLLHKG